jgi:hypothetical protein
MTWSTSEGTLTSRPQASVIVIPESSAQPFPAENRKTKRITMKSVEKQRNSLLLDTKIPPDSSVLQT